MSLLKRRSSSETRKEQITDWAKDGPSLELTKSQQIGVKKMQQQTETQLHLHKLVQQNDLELPGNGMRRRKTSAELISEAKMYLGEANSLKNPKLLTNDGGVRLVNTHRPITPRERGRVLYGKVTLAGRPPSAFSLHYLHKEFAKTRTAKNSLKPIEANINNNNGGSKTFNIQTGGRQKLPALKLHEIKNEPLSQDKAKTSASTTGNANANAKQVTFNQQVMHNGHLLAQCGTETLIELLKNYAGIQKCTEDTEQHINAILVELYTRVHKQDHHCKRGFILGGIYGLVECAAPRILISVARVVLALRVSGSNLTGACKLIFKVARQEQNDHLFHNNDLLELLIDGLGHASPLDDPEACIYGYGSIRFLTTSFGQDRCGGVFMRDLNKNSNWHDKKNVASPLETTQSSSKKLELEQTVEQKLHQQYSLLERMARHGAVDLMVLHLQILNEAGAVKQLSGPPLHSLFQLSAALRAFADVRQTSNTLKQMLDTNWNRAVKLLHLELACPHLIRAYEISIGEFEVQSNIVCALSVLSEDNECCQVLSNYAPRIGMLLGPCLDTTKEKYLSILCRLGYILGNVLANYDNARKEYLYNDVAMEYLINALDIYSKVPLSNKNNQGDTVLDVIVKMIRVIANMSVNVEVGYSLGNTHTLGKVFSNLLSAQVNSIENEGANMKFELRELIHATLAALHNLCFYQYKNNNMAAEQQECCVEGSLQTELPNIAVSLCTALCKCQIEETKIELLRVIGNLTRNKTARDYFCHTGGLPVIVQNLTRNPFQNYDLQACAIGVLVNLLGDINNRAPFLHLKGIELFSLLLRGAVEQEDWYMATIVCQALWNLFSDTTCARDINCNFSVLSDLSDLLADCLDENHTFNYENESTHGLWDDFVMVAADVYERIEKYFNKEQSPNRTNTADADVDNALILKSAPETDEVIVQDF